jgi:toxin ParE1/3/4
MKFSRKPSNRRGVPAPFVNEARLTVRAQNDLISIYRTSIEQFGAAQARRYRRQIEETMDLLASRPLMGRTAEHLGAGLRRHEHGSHVIFYRPTDYGVLIVAFLHARQVPKLLVDRTAP